MVVTGGVLNCALKGESLQARQIRTGLQTRSPGTSLEKTNNKEKDKGR